MSTNSLILLSVIFNEPVTSTQELYTLFNQHIKQQFQQHENSLRVIYLPTPLTGIAWVKGIAIAEYLVNHNICLRDSNIGHFEFPRSQLSDVIEVISKKKQKLMDMMKVEMIIEFYQSRYDDSKILLKNDNKCIIKFHSSYRAAEANHCIHEYIDSNESLRDLFMVRSVHIKEHVIYKANYVSFQSFQTTAQNHYERKQQSILDFIHYKMNKFSDKPVILDIFCPSDDSNNNHHHHNSHPSTQHLQNNHHLTFHEDVYIVCLTHADYRLLKTWPTIFLANNCSLIFQKDIVDASSSNLNKQLLQQQQQQQQQHEVQHQLLQSNKNSPTSTTAVAATTTTTSSSIFTTPSFSTSNKNIESDASSFDTAVVMNSNFPTTTTTTRIIQSYIFWDYGSCPINTKLVKSICGVGSTTTSSSGSMSIVDSNVVMTNMIKHVDKIIYNYVKNTYGVDEEMKAVKLQFTHKRYLFIPNDMKKNDNDSNWNNFIMNDYNIHHYNKKHNLDMAMRYHIDELLKNKNPHSQQQHVTYLFNFITNQIDDFASIASMLKLEDISDIILLSSMDSEKRLHSLSSIVKKHFSWDLLQTDYVSSLSSSSSSLTSSTLLPTLSLPLINQLNNNINNTNNSVIVSNNNNDNKVEKWKKYYSIISSQSSAHKSKLINDIINSSSGNHTASEYDIDNDDNDTDTRTEYSDSNGNNSDTYNKSHQYLYQYQHRNCGHDDNDLSSLSELTPPKRSILGSTNYNINNNLLNNYDSNENSNNISFNSRDNNNNSCNNTTINNNNINNNNSNNSSNNNSNKNSSINYRESKHDSLYNIDLKYISIAMYMRNLFKWRRSEEKDMTISSNNNNTNTASIVHHNYILGEDTTDYDEDHRAICSVQIESNVKQKKFILHIKGANSIMVNKRGERIYSMVQDMIKNRRLYNMSSSWAAEHRLAIVGSDFLAQEERNTCSSALFHFSGNLIIAEIVSLHIDYQNAMLKFIQKLKPRQEILEIPLSLIDTYTESTWEKIRVCYAFKAILLENHKDRISQQYAQSYPSLSSSSSLLLSQENNIQLQCFGFSPKLYEKALEYILSTNPNKEICSPWISVPVPSLERLNLSLSIHSSPSSSLPPSVSSSASPSPSSILHHPTTNTITLTSAPNFLLLNSKISSTSSTAPLSAIKEDKKNKSKSKATELPSNQINSQYKSHSIVFTFTNVNGLLFFSEYDEDFCKYVKLAFDSIIDENNCKRIKSDLFKLYTSTTAATTTSTTTTISNQSSNHHHPQLLSIANISHHSITIYAKHNENLNECLQYLQKLDLAINKIEVFLPRVTMKKHKEISSQISQQSNKLKAIRGKEENNAQKIKEKGKSNNDSNDTSSNVDTNNNNSNYNKSKSNVNNLIPISSLSSSTTTTTTEATSVASIQSKLDPLTTRGYITVRSQPFIYGIALNKTSFPLDITIIILSSSLTLYTNNLIDKIRTAFKNLDNDYIFCSIIIPQQHYMYTLFNKENTLKDQINNYNLVSMKWVEYHHHHDNNNNDNNIDDSKSNSKDNNNNYNINASTIENEGAYGILRVWAFSKNNRNMFMKDVFAVERRGDIAKIIYDDDNTTTFMNSSSITGMKKSSTTTSVVALPAATLHAVDIWRLNDPTSSSTTAKWGCDDNNISNMIVGMGSSSCSSSSFLASPDSSYNSTIVDNGGIGSGSIKMTYKSCLTSNTIIDSTQLKLESASSSEEEEMLVDNALVQETSETIKKTATTIPSNNDSSQYVYVSDAAILHLLQLDQFQVQLYQIIQKCIDDYNIIINYPITNQSLIAKHAYIELLGHEKDKLYITVMKLNDFIQQIMNQMKSIHIILSTEQYNHLISVNDEKNSHNTSSSSSSSEFLNKLQHDNCIYLTIDPSPKLIREVNSLIDFRFSTELIDRDMKSNIDYDELSSISSSMYQQQKQQPSTMISTIGKSTNSSILFNNNYNENSNTYPYPNQYQQQKQQQQYVDNDQLHSSNINIKKTNDNSIDEEMISVLLYNMFSRRSIEISIISSNSSDVGWTWGVNNLALFVGNSDFGLNAIEILQLNSGEILIHSDRITGKTILRMRPGRMKNGDMNGQVSIFSNTIMKLLQKANEIGLRYLVISSPTNIKDTFPDLSVDLIRSLTVESIVRYIKNSKVFLCFAKIICIELGLNKVTIMENYGCNVDDYDKGMKTNHNSSGINSNTLIDNNNNTNKRIMERKIEPAMKDRMARTMMLLLERQEAEQINLLLQSSYNQRPLLSSTTTISSTLGNNVHHHDDVGKLTLLTCNVPLPASFYTVSLTYGKSKGCKSILIKGLLINIIQTIDEIKAKLLSYDISNDPFMKSSSPLLSDL